MFGKAEADNLVKPASSSAELCWRGNGGRKKLVALFASAAVMAFYVCSAVADAL